MPLLTNLVEYLKCDEASGSRAGAHGAHTLTIGAGAAGSLTGKVYALAADFEVADATKAYLVNSSADFTPGDTDFTIAVWSNPESSVYHALATKIGATNGAYRLYHEPAHAMKLNWDIFGAAAFGSGANVESAQAISLGTWYLTIAWHDSVNNLIGISVNDTTAVTAAATLGTYATSVGDFEVGRSQQGPMNADGQIGPVMYWNKVLTSGERTELYNLGNGLTYEAIAGTGLSLNLAEPVIGTSFF